MSNTLATKSNHRLHRFHQSRKRLDQSQSGWVSFIEKAKFAEGMSKFGELMGYTED